ncbi:MAG: type I methionyl aminopeptidase [Chloroflexota bacterium]|nr:type I methionyl aminopeptidase [Dehalococcoidia bacterium]MDW8254819.1 type I methionyl aminopeptidase [Chloroflexota bacterium]
MTSRRIVLKSPREIALMREAGRIAALALRETARAAEPGVTTADLDRVAEAAIRARGGIPSFKGLYGFPASICSSLNDEIVHGVPSKNRTIRSGDLVKIDLGVSVEGYHADTALTVGVGAISPAARQLIEVTEGALWAGIHACCAGRRVRDISAAIESYIVRHGNYGIVRRYVGHGIGREFHEPPQVPNYVDPQHPVMTVLRPGLVLAIEPMVNAGSGETTQRPGDRWTVYTADGSLSAHFEHTVAITAGDPEVLTHP